MRHDELTFLGEQGQASRRRGLAASGGTALLLLACGVYDPGAEAVFEAEEPITGGALVTPGENTDSTKPFGAAVQLSLGPCSGVKIDARRFVTAAHCVSSFPPSTVRITNALSPDIKTAPLYNIVPGSILRHPSFAHGSNGGPGTDTGIYDVAVFSITQDTPSIPAVALGSFMVFAGGTDYTGVAYGCDDDATSRLNKKQKGIFEAKTPDLVRYISDTGAPKVCSGDSGSPLFATVGLGQPGVVVGITSGLFAANSIWSRISNVREWILDPKTNLFANSSRGYLMNGAATGTAVPRLRCAVSIGTSVTNGADVKLGDCDHFSGQFSGNLGGWTLVGSGPFQIVNRWSQLCLGTSGDNVAAFTCSSSSTQLWAASALNNTYARFKNQSSQKCLGAESGDGGADVRQYSCSLDNRQSWIFTR
jgi:hypothetical protein